MVVGVDVSSKRIDLAYLDADGRPQRWHQQLDPKAHLIDRLRSISVQWPSPTPATVTMISAEVPPAIWTNPGWEPGHGVTDVAIEYPYAPQRNAIAALMATVGVITRQAPPWARVAWPSSGELRAAIGARNTKQSAHDYLRTITGGTAIWGWNEHEIDALVACVGWTRILEAQDAA